MRKIGALVALAAVLFTPSPSEAFGLSLGPFHIGLPFVGFRHRHRIALASTAGLDDETSPKTAGPAQGLSALLYPALALPAVYDDVFGPPPSPTWPFGYDAIFQTAFAKVRPDTDAQACRQPDHGAAIAERIKNDTKPTGFQLQLLQKLGGALGMASGYLAKSCSNEIPAQPVARLQLMEWQIEKLATALDIVRPPLQDFEQSLKGRQRTRFTATPSKSTGLGHTDILAPACAAAPPAAAQTTSGRSQPSIITSMTRSKRQRFSATVGSTRAT